MTIRFRHFSLVAIAFLALSLFTGRASADTSPFQGGLPLPVFASATTPAAAPAATPATAAPDAAPSGPAPEAAQTAKDDGRFFVGQETCSTCHQQEATNWAHTTHAKVFNLHPRDSREEKNCEACHGPGSAHVEDPSDFTKIISFSHKSKTPIHDQNEQCLSCHKGGQRIFWHDSIHDQNKLACSDCHNPMGNFAAHGLTAKESISQTCFSCHKEQHADFAKRSHMPLLEGKITCTDCHNPHGSATAPLLKADSIDELCFTCHADKRGPMLFEHEPVREDCTNCHTPHGSTEARLLKERAPFLCISCHMNVGGPPGSGSGLVGMGQALTANNIRLNGANAAHAAGRACMNCHVQVHGSNSPNGSALIR